MKNQKLFMIQMDSKEKEILNNNSSNKKKIENSKKEYKNIQAVCVIELLKKLIINITPIEYKIFSTKYIKLKEIEPSDPLDKLSSKIEENIEMLEIIKFFIIQFE